MEGVEGAGRWWWWVFNQLGALKWKCWPWSSFGSPPCRSRGGGAADLREGLSAQLGKRWGWGGGTKQVLRHGGWCDRGFLWAPLNGAECPPSLPRGSKSPLLSPPGTPLIVLFTSARSGRERQLESANSAPFCVSAGARSWSLFFNPLTG